DKWLSVDVVQRRRRRGRRLSAGRASPAVPSISTACRRHPFRPTLDENDMKKPAATLMTAVPLAAALAVQPALAQQTAPSPPVARKVPHTTSIHGYTLTDDYFWLREKANPGVTAYLE